jgi:hypothetical protein
MRRGVHRIPGEALAACGPLQTAALLMAALRASEPYFPLRRIRFRQARGHGPAAAMGAFHQQSVRLDHGRGSNIEPHGSTTIGNRRWFLFYADAIQRRPFRRHCSQ